MGFFTEARHGSGVVVSVTGELDIATAPLLHRRLCELLCLPIDSLTVNLAGVTFMDSTGLAVLVRLLPEADDRDVPFALASVPHCVQRVLEVTDTDGLFDIR
ncbi:MAG TPA: STAS domain-containing protein [Acidimicrobiia bacterium]